MRKEVPEIVFLTATNPRRRGIAPISTARDSGTYVVDSDSYELARILSSSWTIGELHCFRYY